MAVLMERLDAEARRIVSILPSGPRLVVLGSTEFWHPDSERTCTEIGRLLAVIPDLALITGGVEGIGEAVGRAFFRARTQINLGPLVFHLLPKGEPVWDYGETLFAGADMTERREILGRIAKVFLMVEGGPRAGHEADVARAHGATVIPVGRSGGYAATLVAQINRPEPVDRATWDALGSSASSPEETARAAVAAVRACLRLASPA